MKIVIFDNQGKEYQCIIMLIVNEYYKTSSL